MKTGSIFSQRFSWLLTAGILVGVWLGGCQAQTGNNLERDNDKPRVVSTSTIIADLTTQVGGDEIEHQGILQPGSDPHVYEPTPKDNIALEKADLIFYNGYNLEPGLIKMMNATGNQAEKFAVGEVVKPLDYEYKGQKEPDPHVWGDAKNAILMVKAIRDRLSELSPEDKAEFTNNAAQLTKKLERLDRWINQQIATIPEEQRKLVTTHDAFQYYAHAYNLKIIGTLIGISTEEQPSAQTVKQLTDSIQKANVPAIFAETTINPKLIQTVAEEAGVQLASQQLYSDSIGAPGSEGDSYLKMLVTNTKTIVEALGGKYQDFAE
ncbi:periplasmic solute binding protein [Stanieria cyanosphaera PCC 7437]|uniref:Periplasmic solute binding protein n=1 Tax=Stanieria cyanosphaera (strain ATCC 29371 / PCC 7437) TaxID=111780 RepID=K9XPD7_STAC7|nr:metal ABC transporter substrate-binding protein [Stanieria cyanosphaera]AFZ34393.1 periplasmic solute binding protein [Stanieria cyanosphaera PCC 7437]